MQLTERHYKCIELLIKGHKYTEIAEMVPCNRQSIYNWLEDEVFKAELDKCRREIKTQSNNRILAKLDTYVDRIEQIALNSTSDNVKLNALQFLYETVNGKATTKIEQTSQGSNEVVDKNIDDMLSDLDKVEDNVINLKDISQG